MSRQPSDATLLRQARADLKREHSDRLAAQDERNTYRQQLGMARIELAEWKRRFDLLLERTPKESGA